VNVIALVVLRFEHGECSVPTVCKFRYVLVCVIERKNEKRDEYDGVFDNTEIEQKKNNGYENSNNSKTGIGEEIRNYNDQSMPTFKE
jgi:hypothetical protein